ncbi:MAG: hypothetical protein LBV67_09260 [Streptococcaceae bacterium]|jgi:hypothetical protein|nr:hypothetical protein [Streptococcaceae bacterium]
MKKIVLLLLILFGIGGAINASANEVDSSVPVVNQDFIDLTLNPFLRSEPKIIYTGNIRFDTRTRAIQKEAIVLNTARQTYAFGRWSGLYDKTWRSIWFTNGIKEHGWTLINYSYFNFVNYYQFRWDYTPY